MIPFSHAEIKIITLDSLFDKETMDFSKVLFLDFDGVLHPEGCAKASNFCYLPVFQSLLERVDPGQTLPIVISSLWREHCTLEQLRGYFPQRLAAQIVGVTPCMSHYEVATVRDWTVYGGEESKIRHRQREIHMWMNAHAPEGEWLAIDDRAEYFHKNTPNLFLVPKLVYQGDSGITEYQAPILEARLRKFLQN